jgi:hypothetical protein
VCALVRVVDCVWACGCAMVAGQPCSSSLHTSGYQALLEASRAHVRKKLPLLVSLDKPSVSGCGGVRVMVGGCVV